MTNTDEARAPLEPEFDPEFYRRHNGDLAAFSDEEAATHYRDHGGAEGRLAAGSAVREMFLDHLPETGSTLEIGPFCNPMAHGANVRYADVLDRDELLERATQVGYTDCDVPHIHYVIRDGSLAPITETFDRVVSSHVIEHQPDLVRHLGEVADLLPVGGAYFLIVPDGRYCFDHFIARSTIADVLSARWERRTRHTLKSVIEHVAFITHNDPARHWAGDHADNAGPPDRSERIRGAIDMFDEADGAYIDVHAWQFEPNSFREICTTLFELDLTDLTVERAYQTPRGRFEFTAVLRKARERPASARDGAHRRSST